MLDLTLLKHVEDEEEDEQGDGGAEQGYDEPYPHPGLWSMDLAIGLGHKTEKPPDSSIQWLDINQWASMTRAVDALNRGAIDCEEGLIVVFSSSNQMYFLLVRADKEEEGIKAARDVFDIEVEQ